jgi:hypothetical protein
MGRCVLPGSGTLLVPFLFPSSAVKRDEKHGMYPSSTLSNRCKNTELSEYYALLSRDFLNLEVERIAIIVLGRDVRKAMEKDQPA